MTSHQRCSYKTAAASTVRRRWCRLKHLQRPYDSGPACLGDRWDRHAPLAARRKLLPEFPLARSQEPRSFCRQRCAHWRSRLRQSTARARFPKGRRLSWPVCRPLSGRGRPISPLTKPAPMLCTRQLALSGRGRGAGTSAKCTVFKFGAGRGRRIRQPSATQRSNTAGAGS